MQKELKKIMENVKALADRDKSLLELYKNTAFAYVDQATEFDLVAGTHLLDWLVESPRQTLDVIYSNPIYVPEQNMASVTNSLQTNRINNPVIGFKGTDELYAKLEKSNNDLIKVIGTCVIEDEFKSYRQMFTQLPKMGYLNPCREKPHDHYFTRLGEFKARNRHKEHFAWAYK